MKRFGEISIGDFFFFSKKKMKKLDEYNAVTVVDRGKEHFLFLKRNLVEEEFVEVKKEVCDSKISKFFDEFLNVVEETKNIKCYYAPYIPLEVSNEYTIYKNYLDKSRLHQKCFCLGNSKEIQDELDQSFL